MPSLPRARIFTNKLTTPVLLVLALSPLISIRRGGPYIVKLPREVQSLDSVLTAL
jgi:hypothetical protein